MHYNVPFKGKALSNEWNIDHVGFNFNFRYMFHVSYMMPFQSVRRCKTNDLHQTCDIVIKNNDERHEFAT